MPAKRRYNVKGTNDFLVLAAIFFFLCLWAIKDAWFPSPKVVKKHPPEIVVAFEVDGAVEKVFVEEGHSIGEHQVLANLRVERVNKEYVEAKALYSEAKKKHAMMELASKNAVKNGATDDGIEKINERLAVATTAEVDTLARVEHLRDILGSSELKSPSKGAVKQVLVTSHSMVKAGETVMVIDPKDHFYLFNKSLSIFSFLAFWVFLTIHILAR